MNYKYLHTGLDGADVFAAIVDGVEVGSFVKGENPYYEALREDVILNAGAALDVDVPDWLQADADQTLFNRQLQDYAKAVERLSHYELAVGREEVREMQPTGEQVWNEETEQMEDVMREVVVVIAIDPVEPTVERTVYSDDPMAEPTVETIENPLITQDNAERAEAQAVIDATPQPVIDEYNS